MNLNETIKLFAQIAALYPREASFARADATMVKIWCEMLADIPATLAAASIRAHAATSPFAPSVSDIRSRALQFSAPETRITGEELWSLTCKGISLYGRNLKHKALERIPEYARAFADRWFLAICDSTEVGVVRGQFLKAWEAQSAKQRDVSVMPQNLSAMIGGLAQRMMLGTEATHEQLS